MSTVCGPRRIQSVHVESIHGELCVYDIARQRVHSLNHTAVFVWERCNGRTAPAELAAALSAEASINDAVAVVQLTLQELAVAELRAAPIDEVAPVSRRDLFGRGVAAAAIPAIYSIVAPTPAAAQSPPPTAAPTLTSVSPNQGTLGTTVAVTLTGTNFVVAATTVTVSGGVTINNCRGQHYVADRQLRTRFDRSARWQRGDGHDRRRDKRPANLHRRSARADADQRYAESRHPGDYGSRHLDGARISSSAPRR